VLVDAGQSRALRIDCSRNLPGFPDGISGAELLDRLRAQVAGVHGTVTEDEVRTLAHDGQGGFIAQVGQRRLTARQVLLATGVVDREPPLPGLDLLRRRGLLRHCPVCDGHEHTGQRILVLGDGRHAAAEAAFLAHYSARVTLAGVAAPAPVDSTADSAAGSTACNGGARFASLPSPACMLWPQRGGGLLAQLKDGGRHRFDVVYVAMGVSPRHALAAPLGALLDGTGNLAIDARCRTSVPGLYAAGDVVGGLDQLVVACAQGAIAATAVHNSL
jgi:thioredoxin reductase (NADPH)